jgi:hypothetical protein
MDTNLQDQFQRINVTEDDIEFLQKLIGACHQREVWGRPKKVDANIP